MLSALWALPPPPPPPCILPKDHATPAPVFTETLHFSRRIIIHDVWQKTKPEVVPSDSPAIWVRLLKYNTNIAQTASETM